MSRKGGYIIADLNDKNLYEILSNNKNKAVLISKDGEVDYFSTAKMVNDNFYLINDTDIVEVTATGEALLSKIYPFSTTAKTIPGIYDLVLELGYIPTNTQVTTSSGATVFHGVRPITKYNQSTGAGVISAQVGEAVFANGVTHYYVRFTETDIMYYSSVQINPTTTASINEKTITEDIK